VEELKGADLEAFGFFDFFDELRVLARGGEGGIVLQRPGRKEACKAGLPN
jgi:hypothetical protein